MADKDFKYSCFFEQQEWEKCSLDYLFWAIKERLLVEITLESENWLYIRQRKDVPITYETFDKAYEMHYWEVYLTDWTNIYDIRTGRGTEELEEWIEDCKNFKP